MGNLFLKYSVIGAVISFAANCLVELLFKGAYKFDMSNVILYTLIFTLCWGICMTLISLYNYYNKQNADNIPDEVNNMTSEDGGVLYYYNDFKNGMCKVERIEYNSPKDLERKNYKTYFGFVNEDGEFISKKWYVGASDFFDNGVAVVELLDKNGNEVFNIIDKTGEELSLSWFYSIYGFSDGLCKVGWNDGTINFINEKGELMWKEWKKELSIDEE